LNLKFDLLVSKFVFFKFNLYRYNAAELHRECRVARLEKMKAKERQQRIARECALHRKRNEVELDGLKRVHAAHLYLRQQREAWRDGRHKDAAAREVGLCTLNQVDP
jgi:hypothetical protein